MNDSDRCVDIIIPIYNAFDELNKCIDSVRKYTDLCKHRLVLIDDNSSDKSVYDYVEQQKGTNVVVIHNEVNKGFSAGVNIGFMQSADNDVVLLNSDTIVTARWLDKMIQCAYLDVSTGTVTPLSNNATLCSVPNMFEENELECGMSVDDVAEIVERVSLKKYPELSVANGFCMYIKRQVINDVGFFDADTYKRGYGEENDFCNRAQQVGYVHVMCDDTYIYHSGSKSFVTEEKMKLLQEHDKILRERYPEQMRKNDIYVRDNPNSDIGENLKVYLALHNGKKNILYVVHSDFRTEADDNIGGTQFHVKQLTDGMREEFNIFVAARNKDRLDLSIYVGEKCFVYQYYIGAKEELFRYRDIRYKTIWENVLSAFSIDIVHVHHSVGLSLDIFYAAKSRKIPLMCTLHDYYYICPSEKLLDESNHFCGEICAEDKNCDKCLRNRKKIFDGNNFLKKWRFECKAALKLCDYLFIPSQSAKDEYLKYYPELDVKLQVIEHGSNVGISHLENSSNKHAEGNNQVNLGNDNCSNAKNIDLGNRKLNIAFIGGINVEKGGRQIAEIIKKSDLNVKWYIFGGLGCNELETLDAKNLVKTGWYKPEELPRLILENDIDLIGLLSVWPETYSYTLSEAINCNVPVIVTDIGALGERIDAINCGWKVPVNSIVDEFKRIVEQIQLNPEILLEKKIFLTNRNSNQSSLIKSFEQMLEEYKKIYQATEIPILNTEICDYRFIDNGRKGRREITFDFSIENSNQITIDDYYRVVDENNRIKESVSYRLSKKMLSVRFPGKYKIYSWVKKRMK